MHANMKQSAQYVSLRAEIDHVRAAADDSRAGKPAHAVFWCRTQLSCSCTALHCLLQVQGVGAHSWAGDWCCCSSCVLAIWCFGLLLQQAFGRQVIFSPSEHLAVSQKQHPYLSCDAAPLMTR